ncbi:MAG TPA: hypothetical protein VK779_05715, partial [Rhizomicrobium sp.]|nr:hypothetical protein [Rhizomicrobium sp.]
CEAKNDKLLAVGKEILDAYSKFSFNDAVFANEPFIGERRVELENLAQDYGDKLYDGKFDPRAVHAPATSTTPAPANATPSGASK